MQTEAERRARAQGYVETVVKSLTNQPKIAVKQFQVGGVMALAWNRLSSDGIRSQTFTVGRVVEIEGELRLRHELTATDLRAARRAPEADENMVEGRIPSRLPTMVEETGKADRATLVSSILGTYDERPSGGRRSSESHGGGTPMTDSLNRLLALGREPVAFRMITTT